MGTSECKSRIKRGDNCKHICSRICYRQRKGLNALPKNISASVTLTDCLLVSFLHKTINRLDSDSLYKIKSLEIKLNRLPNQSWIMAVVPLPRLGRFLGDGIELGVCVYIYIHTEGFPRVALLGM